MLPRVRGGLHLRSRVPQARSPRFAAGNWLRRLFALTALGVVLYLFWPLVAEVQTYGALFRRVRWDWLGVALLAQVASYVCLAWLNILLLRPFAGSVSLARMMAILPAMAFIQVAVPSAGASGVVMRARLLRRGGYSAEASTFSLLVETALLVAVQVASGLIGLLYLIRSRRLSAGQTLFLALVVVGVLCLAGLVVWVGRDRRRTGRWLGALLPRLNRLRARFGRPALPEAPLAARLDAFYSGLERLVRTSPWPPLVAAIGRTALDIATLYACFWAFHYPVRPGVLLTGYGLMLLLSTFSALPGGLGMADASLAILYAELGAPGEIAVVAALSYRLLTFWLLRLVGFVTWQMLERLDRTGTRGVAG